MFTVSNEEGIRITVILNLSINFGREGKATVFKIPVCPTETPTSFEICLTFDEEFHSPYIYFIRTFCAVPCEAVRLCKNFSQRCVSMCVNNSLLSSNVLVLVI